MPYKDKEKQKESQRKASLTYYYRDREKHLEQQKKWRYSLRQRVLIHYSNGLPKCNCCGETTDEFLTVDHINNDGVKQRKQYNHGGHHNYRFIIKNNFPEGFRILCYNCNCGRARTQDKICPHKK